MNRQYDIIWCVQGMAAISIEYAWKRWKNVVLLVSGYQQVSLPKLLSSCWFMVRPPWVWKCVQMCKLALLFRKFVSWAKSRPAIDGPAKAGPAGLPATPMLSGVVIGVLSVSWSAELLLSFSAPRIISTPLLKRTTSGPLTHDQHTQCCWPHSHWYSLYGYL